MTASRTVIVNRKTAETDIQLELNLDGTGIGDVQTGIGFLDHMLGSLAKHAAFDLTLHCRGDLHIDDHHTAEDCALALGDALQQAVADKKGLRRFGHAYAPLDESLARAVVDLSGRPCAEIHLDLKREAIGTIACENIVHIFRSLATAGQFTLHVDIIRGDNDHHKAEAAFKALALALRTAVQRTASDEIPSTKGVL